MGDTATLRDSPTPAVILRRSVDRVPIASSAAVMGTGIVSTAESLGGHQTLARVLLALAALLWLTVATALAARAVRSRESLSREAQSPAVLTAVAATAVLGSGVAGVGWHWAADALLAIALVLWLATVPPVLAHWARPTVGVSLMLTVSTESLAVLAAVLAEREHSHWLLAAAIVPLLIGLAFYLWVMAGFDLRQLTCGHGDQWIAGGALAISALAAGQVLLSARRLDTLSGARSTIETFSLVLWALTMAWLPVLLAGEVLRPRLGYDVRRWATVFPLGMYAACSFVVGAAAGSAPIGDFARAWTWVALAAWCVVFAAMIRRGLQVARADV